MDEKIKSSWERVHHPEILKTNIITASIFSMAFEMLKSSFIDKIETFHTNVFYENGMVVSPEYKEEVLPSNVEARVSVEAGVTMPWYRYLGNKGTAIGIDTFGASAPIEKLMEHFGFSVDNVVDKTLEVVK